MPKREAKSYTYRELRNLKLDEDDSSHLIHDLLEENATLVIGGPAKSFKSFLLNTLAIDLITGRNLFATYRSDHGRTLPAFQIPHPCRVLLLEQEMGERSMLDRLSPIFRSLNQAQQDLVDQNLVTRSLDFDITLDTENGYSRLVKVVKDATPRVVLFDPLIDFHTSNENSTDTMQKVMRRFDLLKQALAPLAVVFSHHEGHENTAKAREGVRRLRGNTTIGAKVDSAILVTVYSRQNLQLRLDFILRRSRPIDALFVHINDNLRVDFLCWNRDTNKKAKLVKLDPLEDSSVIC